MQSKMTKSKSVVAQGPTQPEEWITKGRGKASGGEYKYFVFWLWCMDLSKLFGLFILNGCHLLHVNYTLIDLVLEMT